MTDKPIIIDGVDVSGCKLYRDEVSFVGGETITDVCSIWIWQRDYSGLEPSCVMKCHCSDNSNCYYKQYKRKEQECEELKATLEVIAGRPCFNPNDCNGHCLPNCKWNAHKLAQKALGNDF